jgi:hypothetical protein
MEFNVMVLSLLLRKLIVSKNARNKSLKHRHFVAGQFLSRAFVVLLRKSIPQNHNLKTAA